MAQLGTVYGVRVLVELMELGLSRNDVRSGIVAVSSFHCEENESLSPLPPALSPRYSPDYICAQLAPDPLG